MKVWQSIHSLFNKRKSKTGPEIVAAYYKHRKIKRVILIICIIFFALSAILWYLARPVYKQISENVYEVLADMDDSMFLRAGNTKIYDKNNEVIGSIGNEKYKYVEISEISDYIQEGYISKEDRNFLTHKGVDYKALVRAGFSLVKNKGKITQGGSTITQQVVKNNLLTQERSYIRKLSEIYLAKKIEKDYTKAQIMEFYCNSNYYGNGCYGVEGASEYYFGKKADNVTLAEAAILVATSNSPNNYNPVADYELSMQKKTEVLDGMLLCGYITQEEHDQAAAEQPEIVQKSENVENESYLITYALHCAALDLMSYDGFEFQYTFDSEDTYKKYSEKYDDAYNRALEEARTGGYTIYTSFDMDAQKLLQAAVDAGLAGFKNKDDEGIYKLQGAAVCVDNSTGMVSAIVGGREAAGSFNRGYQAARQPGSCIKPLLDYGPGLNEGVITAGSVMQDKQQKVLNYSPTNASNSYMGDVTVREALVRSLNTVALQTLAETGLKKSMTYLAKLHFRTLTYTDMIAPATSIGGFTNGATVVDMAKGYATLANSGKYTENDCILSLTRFDGEVIYKSTDETISVYTEDTAFILSDIMHGLFTAEYGAGHEKNTNGQIYAGKTGSTNNKKDAWFCGYSAHYTTAVWTGYDTPKDLGYYGSAYPMEIWLSYMNSLASQKNLPVQNFDCPSTVKMDSTSGDYISELAQKKREDYLRKQEEDSNYSNAKKAVETFEAFQITKMSEAESFKDKYQEAYDAVSKLTNQTHRVELMDRIAYKYDLLNKDVINTWNDAIAAYNKKVQEEKDHNNALEAQRSLEQGQQEVRNQRIKLVEYYIDSLKDRTVYTETIDQLIDSANAALEACKGYEEYDQLKNRVDEAIGYAESLPAKDTSPVPAVPQITEESKPSQEEYGGPVISVDSGPA